MTQFVAFLRAINVGGRTVRMDQLRKLFEKLEFSNVETFIASGNVAFQSAARNAGNLEKKIAGELQRMLGYEVATFIRSDSELRQIARHRPFDQAEGHSLYVALLAAPPDIALGQKLLAFRNKVDDFAIHGREVYWLSRGRMSESAFSGALLEKTLRMPATLRNVTTIRKLAAKYCPSVSSRA